MRVVSCDKTANPNGVELGGRVRWLRVVLFTAADNPAVTLGLGYGPKIPVNALAGYEAPAGGWEGIKLEGTLTVEISTDSREPYPGPPAKG